MGDVRKRLREQGSVLGDYRLVLGAALAGECPDADCAVVVPLDEVEIGEAIQVDQHRRPGQAEVHDRDETLSAGQNLGLVTVLAE